MKERTSDIVFKNIQAKIFRGEWKQGDRITTETQMAEELGVSRISVREAIEKLATLGILSKKQGGGTYVNDLKPSIYFNKLIPMFTLDRDNYMEILEFRLITEVESIKLCVERCSDEKIDEIEKSYEIMLEHKEDIDKFTEEDLNFHMKIAEGSNNPLIIKVNEVLKDILRYHQIELYKGLGPSGGIKEHKIILDAIKNRDAELASIYARRHIERTIEDLKRHQKNV
ncbi:FadR/GntR family transcriptional regulator [Clostridium sp. DL1XJH146]